MKKTKSGFPKLHLHGGVKGVKRFRLERRMMATP
jgi:hypothetical protein